MTMEIEGHIAHIRFIPTMCNKLERYSIENLGNALTHSGAFMLSLNNRNVALSRWISAKRTRSWPYARVYDTLGFDGKRMTIIPIYKDEGLDGDRDYIQYDTFSLMTLLQVHVVLSYYVDGEKNLRYENKITNQRHDLRYVEEKLFENLPYNSDAFHWNSEQISEIGEIGERAIRSYEQISQRLGIKMHSASAARKRIEIYKNGADAFREMSRKNGVQAQRRESVTNQPKELLSGEKAIITITNLYNGLYPFTVDEASIVDNQVFLIEAKHTKGDSIPSRDDIKDGILKMFVFKNLGTVELEGSKYKAKAILKLTNGSGCDYDNLGTGDRQVLDLVKREAEVNEFFVTFNGRYL